MASVFFAGVDASERARRAGEAILARGERVAMAAGHGPFTETAVDVVGAGDGFARPGTLHGAQEALVRIAARHPDREALDLLARERASMGLVAQGLAGLAAGRARAQPVIRLFHALIDKAELDVAVQLDGERRTIAIAPGSPDAVAATEPMAEPAAPGEGDRDSDTVTVPLRRIAYVRSGDKGNDANIGVIAREPDFAAVIREQVTASRVAEVFAAWLQGAVHRYDVPGIDAINLLLRDVLGGRGGTTSLRLDWQAKSYGAMLLALPVGVPAAWEREGRLAAAGPPLP
jgi:hypothetical protein